MTRTTPADWVLRTLTGVAVVAAIVRADPTEPESPDAYVLSIVALVTLVYAIATERIWVERVLLAVATAASVAYVVVMS
jgi:hypothetical protein